MKLPSPAIVGQAAVRRLPRAGLLLLCLAYVLPGFWGREPWKNADMRSFGYMWELATGQSPWLHPVLATSVPALDGLLPYWLGAAAIYLNELIGLGLAPDAAARIPFVILATLALAASWYGVYGLARYAQAQPVAFAFGGEARPTDYARAVADGGVLALLACLGLAQLAHEATPALAQLAFIALAFCGAAGLHRRRLLAAGGLVLGLSGLALSGAPTLAVLLGLGVTLISWRTTPAGTHVEVTHSVASPGTPGVVTLGLLCTAAAALIASLTHEWVWRVQPLPTEWMHLKGLARLLLWFTWPAWPLAAWTVWRWRAYWRSPHMAFPLLFALVPMAATITTGSAERSLLLALPAFAAFAAFALPTLSRSLAALIDWFTLLFFSACSLVIWVVWLAMQTGFPPQPAANVARLAPGFQPSMSIGATAVALAATAAWIGLVRWRVGRHRAAIWKSLVLPASGASLAWLLLMSLWLPLLDYARSSTALAQGVAKALAPSPFCVAILTENESLIAALRYHAALKLEVMPLPAPQHALTTPTSTCPWLLMDAKPPTDLRPWLFHAEVQSPNKADRVMLYRQAR
jgi:hypothetical protein